MVASTKKTPKWTPVEVQKPMTKQNTFFEKQKDFVDNYKYLVFSEAMLGANRLYLFKFGKMAMRLYYFYIAFLCSLTIYGMITGDDSDGSYTMFRETTSLEYFLIVIASLNNKKTFRRFFQQLAFFDKMLNISTEISSTVPVHSIMFWLLVSLGYSLCEYFTFRYVVGKNCYDISYIALSIALLMHDDEQLFFCNMIQTVIIRLKILKAHTQREFKPNKSLSEEIAENKDLDKIEILSNKTHLDTSGLHRAYELLHDCAELLNSVMSFPMILMLFVSGLNTTLLMKKFYQVAQLAERTEESDATLVYVTVRCIKYTTLVITTCYYASQTSKQVCTIRSTLHNALNTFKLDKIERRKIKAFFQLTQDSEFAYALWGVIRLSMSLPLSYASLCTTYLVIFIQFSKFID